MSNKEQGLDPISQWATEPWEYMKKKDEKSLRKLYLTITAFDNFIKTKKIYPFPQKNMWKIYYLLSLAKPDLIDKLLKSLRSYYLQHKEESSKKLASLTFEQFVRKLVIPQGEDKGENKIIGFAYSYIDLAIRVLDDLKANIIKFQTRLSQLPEILINDYKSNSIPCSKIDAQYYQIERIVDEFFDYSYKSNIILQTYFKSETVETNYKKEIETFRKEFGVIPIELLYYFGVSNRMSEVKDFLQQQEYEQIFIDIQEKMHGLFDIFKGEFLVKLRQIFYLLICRWIDTYTTSLTFIPTRKLFLEMSGLFRPHPSNKQMFDQEYIHLKRKISCNPIFSELSDISNTIFSFVNKIMEKLIFRSKIQENLSENIIKDYQDFLDCIQKLTMFNMMDPGCSDDMNTAFPKYNFSNPILKERIKNNQFSTISRIFFEINHFANNAYMEEGEEEEEEEEGEEEEGEEEEVEEEEGEEGENGEDNDEDNDK